MKTHFLFFFFVASFCNTILSQRMISIAPFDKYGKLDWKEIKPKSEEEKAQLNLIELELAKLNHKKNNHYYQDVIEKYRELIGTDGKLNSYGKMLSYQHMARIYAYLIHNDDTCIYNSYVNHEKNYYEFEPEFDEQRENNRKYALKLTKGMQVLNGLIDNAINYADEERQAYLNKFRVHLMENTGYRDLTNYEYYDFSQGNSSVWGEVEKDVHQFDLSMLNSQMESMVNTEESNLAKEQLNKMLEAHRATNYNPNSGYINIGLGATVMMGKETWVGGEFTLGYASNKNQFLITEPLSGEALMNVNLAKFNYQQSLTSEKKDFSFSVMNFAKNHIFSFNLAQFGWQTGPDFGGKARWFYRPEVGITYGCFTLRYGYNLMFNKSIRGFTEKNILTFKISYPLVRLGDYQ